MLPLTFHRRHLRRTTWVTLLVWLFAWGAGVANACQLEVQWPATHLAGGSAQEAQAHSHAVEGAAHHHGHTGAGLSDTGHDADAAKASCLKFCDNETSALSKGQAPQADLHTPALLTPVPWPALRPLPGASARYAMAQPVAHGPPLAIRFLRLTI